MSGVERKIHRRAKDLSVLVFVLPSQDFCNSTFVLQDAVAFLVPTSLGWGDLVQKKAVCTLCCGQFGLTFSLL